MSMLDDLLANAERRARRLPRAGRIAAIMLDDPALLHEVLYRQQRSLWAGHLWAVNFWTDVLCAYVDQGRTRHDDRSAKGTPDFERHELAYKHARIDTEREVPRFMRQRPGSIYLRLPRANPFSRLNFTGRAKLARADTPWFFMLHAIPAFRGYFPPEDAWPLVIREVGYWSSLTLRTNDPDETARMLGMHGFRYRAALAMALRIADTHDPKNVFLARGEFRRRVDRHQPSKAAL